MPLTRRLLILGAGIYQVPLIRRAQQLGFRCIVVSQAGAYPGIHVADEFYPISTTDMLNIVNLARQKNVAGVVTSGTDVGMPSLGAVVDDLGVAGPSYENTLIFSNKYRLKQILGNIGIKSAEFALCISWESVTAVARRFDYPIFVKPIDNSGSRGVTRVDKKEDLLAAWQYATNQSRSQGVLIEKAIDGIEFGAQALIVGGAPHWVILHNDRVTSGSIKTPFGHSLPCNLPGEASNEVGILVQKLIEALNLKNTALNLDLMWSNGTVFVIEIAARLGATCLPELINHHNGMDTYGDLILTAVGEKPSIQSATCTPVAAELVRSEVSGIFRTHNLPVDARIDSHLLDYQIDYIPGEVVRAFKTGPDRLGHIIVNSSSVEKAEDKASRYAQGVEVSAN